MAWSVQYTWVCNNTKGSVLLAAVMHCRRQVKSDAAATIRGHAGGNSEQPAHRVLLGHRIPARGEDGLQGVAHGADKYIRDDEPQTCRA